MSLERFKSSEEPEEELNLVELPENVLGTIFSYLDNKSKFQVSLTCRHFNDIVKTYPEVYRTFRVQFKNPSIHPEFDSKFSVEIPRLTRPIPTVEFPGALHILTKRPELFESLLTFFRTNGKYVKCMHFKPWYPMIGQKAFFQILNEVPNVEDLQFNGFIDNFAEDLDDFEVKHSFKRLKTLKLFFNVDMTSSSVEILNQFFGKATNVKTLGLSYNFNLIYNKPKLQQVVIRFDGFGGFVMDAASDQHKIVGNLKQLKFDFQRLSAQIDQSKWNFEHFENFVKTQRGIETFVIQQSYDYGINFLGNIAQYVLSLGSLKQYEVSIRYRSAGFNETLFKRHSTLEKLRISAHTSLVLPFFANLKCLLVDRSDFIRYDVINQLVQLEELTIVLSGREPAYGGFHLKNLKKLTLFETDHVVDSVVFYKIAVNILKNHPNITDLTIARTPPMFNHKVIAQQKAILGKLKNLKRFVCFPSINNIDQEFLDVFISKGKKLESLVFYLQHAFDQNWCNGIAEYLRSKNPSLKFECVQKYCNQSTMDELWDKTFIF